MTKAKDRFRVIKGDANKVILALAKEAQKFDYVFLDPPYKEQQIVKLLQQIDQLRLLNPEALIICETDQMAKLPEDLTGYTFLKHTDYGITELTFYRYQGVD